MTLEPIVWKGHHLVHVHRGRVNHLRFGPYHTVCGQIFDATVTGPPSSKRIVCHRCWEWAIGSDEEGA